MHLWIAHGERQSRERIAGVASVLQIEAEVVEACLREILKAVHITAAQWWPEVLAFEASCPVELEASEHKLRIILGFQESRPREEFYRAFGGTPPGPKQGFMAEFCFLRLGPELRLVAYEMRQQALAEFEGARSA